MNMHASMTAPSTQKILKALEYGDFTYQQLAEKAFISPKTSSHVCNYLLKNGKIHIVEWKRQEQGMPSPIYRIGFGESVQRPKPYSSAEKSRRWKEKTAYQSMRSSKYRLEKFTQALNSKSVFAVMLGAV